MACVTHWHTLDLLRVADRDDTCKLKRFKGLLRAASLRVISKAARKHTPVHAHYTESGTVLPPTSLMTWTRRSLPLLVT